MNAVARNSGARNTRSFADTVSSAASQAPASLPSRLKSAELFEKAKKYFPGGVNSPVRAFKSVYGTPLFIERGDGCRVWDADGNEFA